MTHQWPLMQDNLRRADLDAAIELLRQDDPRLTQGPKVRAFEEAFSEWLGVKHSVFVSSGSSANLLTMHALKELRGPGKVVVPTLTWASDITSVLHAGLEPVFVDIDRRTLGMDMPSLDEVIKREKPLASFVTHCMGYNACLTGRVDSRLRRDEYIEDCCEAIGADSGGRKLGTFGLASNFSFYYAHHMTTIEGGMICTDDDGFADVCRMLRGHGMTREASKVPELMVVDSDKGPRLALRTTYHDHYGTSPDFTFAYAGFNCRNTEIAAAIGLSQLKRLDENVQRRNENLRTFLAHQDPETYQTDFAVDGCSSYALTLVLAHADLDLRDRVERHLLASGVEFRRGIAGGGNQLRQPYLRRLYGDHYKNFPNVEHVHSFGWYVGNHAGLQGEAIVRLCEGLNQLCKTSKKMMSV